MLENDLLTTICCQLNLGELVRPAKRLTGGLMHKMFRMETEKGVFAIKLLNPIIMARADVFDNYKIADELEIKLQSQNIPIVASMACNETKMQCVNNQYFYLFEFVDGKVLQSEEIQKEHCRIVGKLLAKIHSIESKEESCHKDDINIDWDYYINLARVSCPEIVALLEENKDMLVVIQQKENKVNKKLPNIICICHGDMDSKNIMWVDGEPKIIDLECLHYGNPYEELFELALCWSGYEHGDIDYELLKTFVLAYIQEYGKIDVDWETLYYNNSRLGWLEYNVKRALMIECENEEERLLGVEQVKYTMRQILYYAKIREPLMAQLTLLLK